jgi:UDP-GlcNAc3NAcA epimerase
LIRTVSVVGARPQFVKLAPVSRAMAAATAGGSAQIDDVILHTGQHYDPGLSEIFFTELEIPRPDLDLQVGSGSHGQQSARMLERIEEILIERRPDAVIVYGDTNSTLAGALAAAKLHIPVVHIEAGLRSFDRRMPEEINRIVSDHLSDLLLAPTGTAMKNLADENLSARSVLVGDVMLDAILFNRRIAAERSGILEDIGMVGKDFGVVTLHRASNTDSHRLIGILELLNQLSDQSIELIFPVHPRTANRIKTDYPDWRPGKRLHLVEPVGYLDMIRMTESAAVVLTDSGGLQKEAFFLGTPCITMREKTEWPETVAGGGNTVTGVEPDRVRAAVAEALSKDRAKTGQNDGKPFGDGHAAEKIVSEIVKLVG